MSIDNGMFENYLGYIGNKIKDMGSFSDLDCVIDNIGDELRDTNRFLKVIAQEQIISNTPIEKREIQRKLFELVEKQRLCRELASHYGRQKNEEEKEKYVQEQIKLEEQILDLQISGYIKL